MRRSTRSRESSRREPLAAATRRSRRSSPSYRADLEASGKFAGNPMISPARSFLLRVGVEGWSRLSLSEQCSISEHESRLVTWLIVTGRLQPTASSTLVASRLRAGRVAAWVHREFHERFMQNRHRARVRSQVGGAAVVGGRDRRGARRGRGRSG